MTPRLSILCPALFARIGQWSIIEDVRQQCEGTDAELVVLYDDGRITVGEKCNMLHSGARGEYISMVADDDNVADDYVESLLGAIVDHGTDVVTFDVDWGSMSISDPSCKLRPLAAVRRSIAQRFRFPNWWQSEDRAFSKWLAEQSPTVTHISKTIYIYNHRSSKPEFGGREYPEHGRMASSASVAKHARAQA